MIIELLHFYIVDRKKKKLNFRYKKVLAVIISTKRFNPIVYICKLFIT